MKALAAILLLGAAWVAGGCANRTPADISAVDANSPDPNAAGATDANEPARIQSLVLARAWGGFLADAVIAHKQRTGAFPQGAKDPNYPMEAARELHRRHNWVFLVSPHRERAFEQGRFDEPAVAAALDQRIAEIRKLNLRLPWLGESIIRLRQADKLQGPSLVLGRRIVDAQLMDVIAEIRRRYRQRSADPNDPR